ncbi:MAG: ATP-binding protein [Ginsengibacter sp.]
MNTENKETGNPDGKTTSVEFLYLYKLIRFRITRSFAEDEIENAPEPVMPELKDFQPYLKKFIEDELIKDDVWEKEQDKDNYKDKVTVLLVGLAPYLYPDLFDSAITSELPEGTKDFIRIGGARGNNCRFFLPTGETVLFLIAGKDIQRRESVQEIFGAENIFWSRKILWLEDMPHFEPPMHGRIIMSQDYVDLLTMGIHKSPQFSISFPAKRISVPKKKRDPGAPSKPKEPTRWDQLVINDDLKEQIGEIRTWLKFNDNLIADFGKDERFRPGFRTLFFGPPGTGKTFTAKLLGEELDRDVYKIDLSMIVSKYIGETEKNLELLFARAEDKKWILFFDEADALFGKRTNVRDAHDKYANQEVSYLLQRIEDYDGLIILATNMKNNIDDAFIRRFNSILKFPVPNADERKCIWMKLFPKEVVFVGKSTEDILDIPELVKNYELTGGNINNVVHYACLIAYEKRSNNPYNGDCEGPSSLVVYLDDVLNGIKKELIKEGKPFAI